MRILISEYEQCDVAGFRGDSVEWTVRLDVMLCRWVIVLPCFKSTTFLGSMGRH